jgi:hypothetical protein
MNHVKIINERKQEMYAYVALSDSENSFTNLLIQFVKGQIDDEVVFKKMKQEIDNPGNCVTLKIENVDDSLFDMMNNETAIFDDEMKSDDVNNDTLTNFVREIIRQLGGNDNHVEDWVIELCRVEL